MTREDEHYQATASEIIDAVIDRIIPIPGDTPRIRSEKARIRSDELLAKLDGGKVRRLVKETTELVRRLTGEGGQ